MPTSKKKTTKVSYLLYLLIGILGITSIVYGTYLKYKKSVLSFNVEPPAAVEPERKSAFLSPVNIKIASAGVDLPITDAKIVGGVWEISDSGASHLASSKRPGEGGNIVIYGHNKKKLFGPILGIKKGALISLETEDNTIYVYVVEDKFEVNPDQVEVLFPTNYEVLTLYTCTGLLDSKRMIIKAKPLSV